MRMECRTQLSAIDSTLATKRLTLADLEEAIMRKKAAAEAAEEDMKARSAQVCVRLWVGGVKGAHTTSVIGSTWPVARLDGAMGDLLPAAACLKKSLRSSYFPAQLPSLTAEVRAKQKELEELDRDITGKVGGQRRGALSRSSPAHALSSQHS